MSEQQTDGGRYAEESGVVVVEQKSSRRKRERDENSPAKQPWLPAAPSKSSEKIKHNVIPKLKKSVTPDKAKYNVPNKSPLIIKKNAPSTEPMTSKDVTQRKATIPAQLSQITAVQPISSDMEMVSSQHDTLLEKQSSEKQTDQEESSKDEITELRGTHPKYSDWDPRESSFKQLNSRTTKDISWNVDNYLDTIYRKSMEETTRSLSLERKTSFGPFKSATQFTRASGLTINVLKKSKRNITNDVGAGINISISKKCLQKSQSGVVTSNSSVDVKNRGDAERCVEKRAVKVDIEVPYMKIFSVVRSKLSFVRSKFHSVRNLTF